MDVAACAIGRLRPDGPWVGFAPTVDDGYALVVTSDDATVRSPAAPRDLLALATLYFDEDLESPPEDVAATLGDIGALVRHVAEHTTEPDLRQLLADAVDAVDDGLAADVTIARLAKALGPGHDATTLIRRRAGALLADG